MNKQKLEERKKCLYEKCTIRTGSMTGYCGTHDYRRLLVQCENINKHGERCTQKSIKNLCRNHTQGNKSQCIQITKKGQCERRTLDESKICAFHRACISKRKKPALGNEWEEEVIDLPDLRLSAV